MDILSMIGKAANNEQSREEADFISLFPVRTYTGYRVTNAEGVLTVLYGAATLPSNARIFYVNPGMDSGKRFRALLFDEAGKLGYLRSSLPAKLFEPKSYSMLAPLESMDTHLENNLSSFLAVGFSGGGRASDRAAALAQMAEYYNSSEYGDEPMESSVLRAIRCYMEACADTGYHQGMDHCISKVVSFLYNSSSDAPETSGEFEEEPIAEPPPAPVEATDRTPAPASAPAANTEEPAPAPEPSHVDERRTGHNAYPPFEAGYRYPNTLDEGDGAEAPDTSGPNRPATLQTGNPF